MGTWLDDRFLIEDRIATGGFGAVYRARTRDGTPVALKVLHPGLTRDPNMVARFRREGATLTRLSDPHTVTTLAVGETGDGTLYIAMELLSGPSLHDRLQRERTLPWQAAVAIARSVCRSLAEAHAIGVVHRDLKPANIHVETRGGADLVKVIDFGIVKIARGSAIDDGQELTRAGHRIGTYDYMSPEQIVGAACHGTSDIYSLGVVMYEMLTGRRPFARAVSPTAMMTALLTRSPQRPSGLVAIPPALDRIVMRCLEREPKDRFISAGELAAALDRVLARQPTAREEVTAVHPVLGATLVDERTWFVSEAAQRTSENGPAAPTFRTLPGVAVATERRSSPALGAAPGPTPGPTMAPALPPGWRAAPPRPSSQVPPAPRTPCERRASGSAPVPPPRSLRVLWIGLALVGIAASAFALAAWLG